MPFVEIQIEAIERFAAGYGFSDAGSYLRIKGVAKGEIDPAAPENSVIAERRAAALPADPGQSIGERSSIRRSQ